MKLITAIIVALAMSYPAICDSIALFRKKSQAKSGKEKMGGNLSC